MNGAGLLTQIAIQEEGGSLRPLVQYEYSGEQDLTAVTDAMGKVLRMKYSNHLLRQKTDRNNHSFYWKYDKEEDGARAVESWGDGGVLTVLIAYHDKERYNEVRTSRDGKPTRYEYDERSLCTRVNNPDFSETSTTYNERYQVVQTVDEEGWATSFEYNESQTTGVTFADGSKMKFAYNLEGALIKTTNPAGNSQTFEWNPDGTLARAVDEEGREVYVEESLESKAEYQTVIRFLWFGNTLLHEWETGKEGKRRLREREGEKADYILKMEEKADQKARAEAEKGTPPRCLITWVFQDDFIPRAKLTADVPTVSSAITWEHRWKLMMRKERRSGRGSWISMVMLRAG